MRATLFLFLFVSWILSSIAQEELPKVIKRVQRSVVVILTYDENGNILSQGSGFFISQNGDVITCRHVLRGSKRAWVKTSKGKIYPVKTIVAEDVGSDIVRVSVDIPQNFVYPLKLSYSIPEVGERVIVIGSPLGLEQTVSDGIVSAVREIPKYGKVIQITAPISPGSSGSPVLNMKGEVIGIATFQDTRGQNLNFAIPSEKLAKLGPEREKTFTERKENKNNNELFASAERFYSDGLSFLRSGNYEKALSYFKKAVEMNPLHADAYFGMGYCNGELGRWKEAINSYKQAIEIKPRYAEAYNNLGIAYYNLGRFEDAVKSYKRAIEIKPDLAEAYNNLGMVYCKLGRRKDEIESFKKAIRIKSDYAEAYLNLGVAYSELGRWKEAIELFKQAVKIKPDYAEAHYNIGVAYAELGRWKEAIDSYRQAIKIKPDYAKAHYNLGVAYLNNGDRDSALRQYKILKNLNSELANKLFKMIYR